MIGYSNSSTGAASSSPVTHSHRDLTSILVTSCCLRMELLGEVGGSGRTARLELGGANRGTPPSESSLCCRDSSHLYCSIAGGIFPILSPLIPSPFLGTQCRQARCMCHRAEGHSGIFPASRHRCHQPVPLHVLPLMKKEFGSKTWPVPTPRTVTQTHNHAATSLLPPDHPRPAFPQGRTSCPVQTSPPLQGCACSKWGPSTPSKTQGFPGRNRLNPAGPPRAKSPVSWDIQVQGDRELGCGDRCHPITLPPHPDVAITASRLTPCPLQPHRRAPSAELRE